MERDILADVNHPFIVRLSYGELKVSLVKIYDFYSLIPLPLPTSNFIPAQLHNSGLEVIRLFSCPTQLSTKFILLINVKIPTIVGILISISMINTTSERLKARNVFP